MGFPVARPGGPALGKPVDPLRRPGQDRAVAPTYPDGVPRLTDGTVTLRAMTEADLPASVEQSVDPETVRWTTVPSP